MPQCKQFPFPFFKKQYKILFVCFSGSFLGGGTGNVFLFCFKLKHSLSPEIREFAGHNPIISADTDNLNKTSH